MRVRFLLPGEGDLDALRALDPDRDFERFKRGECAWVLQTYLRLAAAGKPVELVDCPPRDGIVVFHAKHRRWLRGHGGTMRDSVLVGIRGDLGSPAIADFEVLQNGFFADGRRRFHVTHWPQPGLVPREPARGDAIRRVAYHGFARNLEAGFRERRWLDFLAARGIEWHYGAAEYVGMETDRIRLAWHDFREVDLVLAVRPPSRRLHPSKPATKLINAWLAGVPALLGAEVAYRELRRSPLDYVEVADVEAATAAVDKLAGDPAHYRALRDRCAESAAELRPERWIAEWSELLFVTIPRLAPEALASPLHRLPLPARAALRRLGRWLTLRPSR
jgi:hypothetical protein